MLDEDELRPPSRCRQSPCILEPFNSFQVRKEKKEDQLNKRRSMVSDAASADAGVFSSLVNSTLRSANQPTVISTDVIAENVRDLHSDNPALQLKATQQFRRFLSIGKQIYSRSQCSFEIRYL